jgi:hypothetical protein
MTPPDERYPDLVGEDAAAQRRQLVAALDHVYAGARLPADRDAAIARLLRERAHVQRAAVHRPLLALWMRRRRRLAIGTLLALVLVVGTTALVVQARWAELAPRFGTPTMTSTAFPASDAGARLTSTAPVRRTPAPALLGAVTPTSTPGPHAHADHAVRA